MEKVLTSLLKRGVIPYIVAAVVVLVGLSGAAAATGTLSSDSSATPTASGSTTSSIGNQLAGYPAAGGANNIVQVINRKDEAFKMEGRLQVNQIPGPNAGPKNEALAFSSCVNCKTLSVALQIDVRRADARNVQPLNLGTAVNYRCSNCITYAVAIQDVIPVADTTQIPNDIRDTARTMDAQLRDFRAAIANGDYTFPKAIDHLNNVIIPEFDDLAGSLVIKRDLQTDPTTPGASPMASATPSPEPPSASPTATVSGAPTESPQPTPSSSP
jgi:hypothetical protein